MLRLIVSSVWLAVFASLALSIHAFNGTEQLSDPAAQAARVLTERCARCHGQNGAALKNVFVLDRDRLIDSRVVVPGDPDSLLLKMVESNAMPPSGPALSDEEKKILRDWVLAGAPKWADQTGSANRPFIDEQKLVASIDQDLLNQPRRSRQFFRYFSLAHLYNAGVSEFELETYRSALGKLINSLSWHKEITRPTLVDAARTVFRIDLRDYNWTAATWELLLSSYPYGLRSADGSNITRITGASVSYVRVDWFAANASVPPLYHDLLALPRSAVDLERQLGVDVSRDLAEEKNVARAGLRASGVSLNNRVLERHVSLHGAYWKSFDFRSSADQQNIFQHPLAFNPAGSEIIFNLPNGLQAYLIVDGLDRRINEAPVAIVSDRTSADDPVIRNGRSCMNCHYDGVRQFRDETRPVIQANLASTFDREKALALYLTQENLDRLIDRDRERFRAAVTLTSGAAVSAPHEEPINALARRFAADISLSQAAAEAGLEPADFQQRVRRSGRLAQLGYAQLLVPGGAMKRDAWDRHFDELALELGLGRPVSRPALGTGHSAPATIRSLTPTPAVGSSPESILRATRTISVSSMTMFLKPDQLEDELRKRPEFEAMGLAIVKDAAKADLMIDLDRPVFTYTFTYSVSSADTRVVVMSGKVIAFDGNLAAPKIAKALMKRIQAVREGKDQKSPD
jgi:mono/diheme cytochrome c family protein